MARGRIFINYRRDDSRADSGRLYDRLALRFPGKVFRDVASLEPGVEWHEAIARVLGQADACIVVIGKDWLNITDAAGRRRLDSPHDTVRQEIVTALARKMRVFPVLVGGAKMPAEEELPPDLQPLCRRNAWEITEQAWDENFNRLLQALERSLGLRSKRLDGSTFSTRTKWIMTAIGAAMGSAALLAVLATYTAGNNHTPSSNTNGQPVSGAPARYASSPPQERPAAQPVSAPEPPARPVLTAGHFVGRWNAAVTANGQSLDEQVEIYRDASFRVMLGDEVAAVGRWRYSPASGSLEITDAANFLNNGVKFACTMRTASGEQTGGACRDRLQNSWLVSLTHSEENLPDIPEEVPRVDISGLTIAEKVAFVETLAMGRCTCPCGLSVLVCLRKDQTCQFSPNIARNALATFLRMTRS